MTLNSTHPLRLVFTTLLALLALVTLTPTARAATADMVVPPAGAWKGVGDHLDIPLHCGAVDCAATTVTLRSTFAPKPVPGCSKTRKKGKQTCIKPVKVAISVRLPAIKATWGGNVRIHFTKKQLAALRALGKKGAILTAAGPDFNTATIEIRAVIRRP